MANERALGISFIYAAQTWRQLAAVFGEHEARALFGLTNVLERYALVLAENGKPIIARLARCIDGKAGRRLIDDQRHLRARLADSQLGMPTAEDRAAAALAEARHRGIVADQESHR